MRTLDKSGEAIAMPPAHGRGVAAPVAEDVETRAARLGVTAERVLQEYARIAFSNINHVVEWDASGIAVKPSKELSEDVRPAIAEIVASAKTGAIYRIKLHDKKPVLDALARHLGLLPPLRQAPDEDDERLDDADDPREFLMRELDRLDREEAARADPGTDAGGPAADRSEL
ncbi:MAG TPA: terminase small subunit [Stellaceae bacterium]|nr:terminase small subunit [Stellaceae bacterium]